MRMRDRIAAVATEDADFYVVLTPEVAAKVAEMPLLEMNEALRNECEPAVITNSERPDVYIGWEDLAIDEGEESGIRQFMRDLAKLASDAPVRQADMFNNTVTLESGRIVEFWVNKKTGEVTVDVLTSVTKAGVTAALFNANSMILPSG